MLCRDHSGTVSRVGTRKQGDHQCPFIGWACVEYAPECGRACTCGACGCEHRDGRGRHGRPTGLPVLAMSFNTRPRPPTSSHGNTLRWPCTPRKKANVPSPKIPVATSVEVVHGPNTANPGRVEDVQYSTSRFDVKHTASWSWSSSRVAH